MTVMGGEHSQCPENVERRREAKKAELAIAIEELEQAA
jgi:hypothetical protein